MNDNKEPQVPLCVSWWDINISKIFPTWHLHALHVYGMWRLENSNDRRRFLANYLEDTHEYFEEYLAGTPNTSPYNNWAFCLSFTLTNFYFILEEMYSGTEKYIFRHTK